MRDRRRPRRSLQAGNARPEAQAGATGGGGRLGWFRKHIVGSIIGGALVTTLTAWVGAFFNSALNHIAPPGAETFCALSETLTNSWPFANAPKPSDRFTILIATIDRDDADHTYTRAVERAF